MVRIVFYKDLFVKGAERGFCFYTNYTGRKAQDLSENSKAAVNFFWPQLDQQIRIEASAQKVPREMSEKYFATRARASQIGAWSSDQSDKIESYQSLAEKYKIFEEKFRGQAVPCPPHWGGYCLFPHEIEFWFGKTGRMHERYVYQNNNGVWDRFMRSP